MKINNNISIKENIINENTTESSLSNQDNSSESGNTEESKVSVLPKFKESSYR